MEEFLAVLGALGGVKAIEWVVTFLVRTRTSENR